jgi:hypothetical protein
LGGIHHILFCASRSVELELRYRKVSSHMEVRPAGRSRMRREEVMMGSGPSMITEFALDKALDQLEICFITFIITQCIQHQIYVKLRMQYGIVHVRSGSRARASRPSHSRPPATETCLDIIISLAELIADPATTTGVASPPALIRRMLWRRLWTCGFANVVFNHPTSPLCTRLCCGTLAR